MFLKLSNWFTRGLIKEDFTWSRAKKALPLFLLLWVGGILLGLVYLLSVRSHLQASERDQVEKMLDSYLASHRSSSRLFGSSYSSTFSQPEPLPRGLVFLRVIRGSDQMVVVGEQVGTLGFKGLINLPPERSGVWLPLTTEKEQRILTIIVRRYDDGVVIQAGMDSRVGYDLFQQLRRAILGIIVGSAVVLWPLTLLFIKRSLGPLIVTREKIAELIQRPKAGLLPERGNGPELDSLYGQINQLIRRNRRLVSEMQQSLDNVAHDLRTPMTRLRSVAEYGLQADNDTWRLREALSDCLEESDRVLAMLKIMMSVAEAESGAMRLELQDIDLTASLNQVMTLYEYVAEEKQVAVHLEVAEALPARVDSTRISQVWANLLDNAIKYGREGGWVKIAGQVIGGEVVVTFTDNGIGISENEQGRIWERLYRGDRSRSQKGLGLGLSYVHAVVAAHQGIVSVSSRLHQGSCFEVRLPVGPVTGQSVGQSAG
jgi:signal transduction histidine kinase